MLLVCYDNDFPAFIAETYEQAAEFFGVSIKTAQTYVSPTHRNKNNVKRYIIRVEGV